MDTVGLRFNQIWVIESLPELEVKSGRELYENVLLPIQYQGVLGSKYSKVNDARELRVLLAAIAAECEKGTLGPILHFEAHGNQQGIELASGEHVPWGELKEILTQINTATKFNLLTILAACDGAHIVKLLNILDRAPMWGLVAPTHELKAGELLRDYSAFYQAFVAELDGSEAVRALNESATGSKHRYAFIHAVQMFRDVYSYYIRTEMSEQTLLAREQELIATLLRRGEAPAEVERFRPIVRRALRNPREHFGALAARFFMYDVIPENIERFPFAALI